MEARHAVVLVLLFCGLAAFLISAVALLVLPGPYQRLHALTPATSLGLPLMAAALAVDTGPGRAAVKFLVIGALVAVTGPAVGIAIGRTVTETSAVDATASGTGSEPPA
ncbi:cation:proton antiporter [Actinacidiphila rubida]|uniref:Multisubunit sodium/proton antiporter, MrpG subunit n=1 Tax=Actinacidiphila rubida TaxID=310780 RepID=A0A1H8TJZ1_9ACTN|nr:monovalent cation/H(+) antiporter subunit G [Actinacidiphila rubida]SEO90893.1 multisubunit sodium/proton antiporter, MrpG subunit [Actinacidiphila rubida]